MNCYEFIQENIIYILAIVAFFIVFICYKLYKATRRIVKLDSLPRNYYGVSLRGVAMNVYNGNSFKFYHVPRFRTVKPFIKPSDTLSVRLYGIDAPKSLNTLESTQPLFFESKKALFEILNEQWVTIKILKIDIFSRIVAKVYTGCFFKKDISLKMLELGMACVNDGDEELFGGNKNLLIEKENIAKAKRIGIWGLPHFESPKAFKARMSRIKM
ncbi:putative endonuclease lcl3 [Dictyocoela muelleri]|nr:putative endonuclease lcl3 [Dictyocoela muelleri]